MSTTEPRKITSLSELWKPFANKVRILVSNMEKRGHPCKVIETIRTYARQKYLYSIGRRGIKGEKPVTWTMKSRHLVGKAADIIPKDGDWNDKAFFIALKEEAEKIGLNTLDEISDWAHVEWTDKAQIAGKKDATK